MGWDSYALGMTTPREKAGLMQATYEAWATEGLERIEGPRCYASRYDRAPLIYDANLIAGVRAETADELAEVLAFADEVHGELGHRHVLAGGDTAPGVLAGLAQAGFRLEEGVHMLLEGELRGPAPDAHDIRLATTDADWRSVGRLTRLWHEEENAQPDARHQISEEASAQMTLTLRAKTPAYRVFLLRFDGVDAAYFGSYPGVNGVGMVEDLYTVSSYRKRGLARALIHHCVADARSRGADSVLIGADSDDTPRFLYQSLGFVPTSLCMSWMRTGLNG